MAGAWSGCADRWRLARPAIIVMVLYQSIAMHHTKRICAPEIIRLGPGLI
jgi:hypothetical protein